jgi:hypothetical protein
MRTFAIVETDIYGNILEDEGHKFYLNHSTLSSMSFGSLDMAWTANSKLEAEGMAARLTGSKFRHHTIVEIS